MIHRHGCQAIVVMLLLTSLIGCGPNAAPMSDKDAAKQLLDVTFQAWKSGQSVADMRAQSPPVYVAEELWNNGFKLTDFKVRGEAEMYGSNVRFQVALVGIGKNGEAINKPMEYLVTTVPAQTIARVDH